MPSIIERRVPRPGLAIVAGAVLLTGCGGGARPELAVPALEDQAPAAQPAFAARGDVPRVDPPFADQRAGNAAPDRYQPRPDPVPDGAPASEAGPQGTSQAISGEKRYDAVGYASWYGDELRGGRTAAGRAFNPQAITAAHPSLPMGSFAEVTALDSGKTILVMIADRGPSSNDRLIDLSRGAAQQLGIDRQGIAGVRVRQVDPPPPDQAALREGRSAAPRLDTPPVLLAALRKRLPSRRPAAVPPPTSPRPAAPARNGYAPPGTSYAPPGTSYPAPGAGYRPPPAGKPPTAGYSQYRPAAPPRADAPADIGATGFFVQVAAVSSRDRAVALAQSLGGSVQAVGSIYRVRLGPFVDRASAMRARDDAASAGYGDAQIVVDRQ